MLNVLNMGSVKPRYIIVCHLDKDKDNRPKIYLDKNKNKPY